MSTHIIHPQLIGYAWLWIYVPDKTMTDLLSVIEQRVISVSSLSNVLP